MQADVRRALVERSLGTLRGRLSSLCNEVRVAQVIDWPTARCSVKCVIHITETVDALYPDSIPKRSALGQQLYQQSIPVSEPAASLHKLKLESALPFSVCNDKISIITAIVGSSSDVTELQRIGSAIQTLDKEIAETIKCETKDSMTDTEIESDIKTILDQLIAIGARSSALQPKLPNTTMSPTSTDPTSSSSGSSNSMESSSNNNSNNNSSNTSFNSSGGERKSAPESTKSATPKSSKNDNLPSTNASGNTSNTSNNSGDQKDKSKVGNFFKKAFGSEKESKVSSDDSNIISLSSISSANTKTASRREHSRSWEFKSSQDNNTLGLSQPPRTGSSGHMSAVVHPSALLDALDSSNSSTSSASSSATSSAHSTRPNSNTHDVVDIHAFIGSDNPSTPSLTSSNLIDVNSTISSGNTNNVQAGKSNSSNNDVISDIVPPSSPSSYSPSISKSSDGISANQIRSKSPERSQTSLPNSKGGTGNAQPSDNNNDYIKNQPATITRNHSSKNLTGNDPLNPGGSWANIRSASFSSDSTSNTKNTSTQQGSTNSSQQQSSSSSSYPQLQSHQSHGVPGSPSKYQTSSPNISRSTMVLESSPGSFQKDSRMKRRAAVFQKATDRFSEIPDAASSVPKTVDEQTALEERTNIWDETKEGHILFEAPEFTAESVDAVSEDSGNVRGTVNLQVTKTPEIMAATLNQLVKHLTSTKGVDGRALDTFLLTYTSFTTPNVLLEKLIQRYHIPNEKLIAASSKAGKPVEAVLKAKQLRVVNFLRKWVDMCFVDITEDLVEQIFAFVEQLQDGGASSLANLIGNVLQAKMLGLSKKKQIQHDQPPPPVIMPKKNSNNSTGTLDIVDIDPLELARQITLIDHELFCKIASTELLNQSWNKPKLKFRSPHVLEMIQRFNTISKWFSSIILKTEVLKERAKVMTHIIQTGKALLSLNNFNGLMAILSALQNSAVYRLNLTKEAIGSKNQKLFQEFMTLMDPRQNHGNYKTALAATRQAPTVPYLGHSLSALTFIEEGNPLRLKGLINFKKCRLMSKVIGNLLQYQVGRRYNFMRVDSIRDLILNLAPTETDDELYDLSLKREPRQPQPS